MCYALHDVAIAPGCATEETVKGIEQPAEQPVHDACRRIFRRPTRLKENRSKRRRQRQRIERRDQRREGDGKRELPVELSVQPTDECHWNEHRGQHQRDRDDRPADFLHRAVAGIERRKTLLDVPLHVLDHDDCVVDDDADRQNQSEQRQRVDRESCREHHCEGADDRDWDRDEWDDRCPPRLQEQNDHDHDHQRGQHQRVDHLTYRIADEQCRIVH